VRVTDLQVFRVLGEALALGFLVGAERYRGRPQGEHKAAGVRTFSIFGLLGGVCGIFDQPFLAVISFAGLATLIAIAYYRTAAQRPGMTTEVAALLVFWIGYLLSYRELPAIALGIVLTVFLASKRPLHHFVRTRISAAEFDATLRFLVVVLVIYPVLPDRAFGPLEIFNPQRIWGLVILVSAIGYAGYFLMRWLGTGRGLRTAALVGGLASTTAVTMDLARRARREPEAARSFGALAVLATAIQGPRLLLILWALDGRLAGRLLMPLSAMALTALVTAQLLARKLDPRESPTLDLENPFSVAPALKFGAILVGVLVVVRSAEHLLGQQATLLAAALAGATSVSAAALSIAEMASGHELPVAAAAWAVLGAVGAATLSKLVIGWLQGTRAFTLWLAGGLATSVGVGLVTLYLQSALQ
jgi:uncharacterized membrane protein (DUF4010 family)